MDPDYSGHHAHQQHGGGGGHPSQHGHPAQHPQQPHQQQQHQHQHQHHQQQQQPQHVNGVETYAPPPPPPNEPQQDAVNAAAAAAAAQADPWVVQFNKMQQVLEVMAKNIEALTQEQRQLREQNKLIWKCYQQSRLDTKRTTLNLLQACTSSMSGAVERDRAGLQALDQNSGTGSGSGGNAGTGGNVANSSTHSSSHMSRPSTSNVATTSNTNNTSNTSNANNMTPTAPKPATTRATPMAKDPNLQPPPHVNQQAWQNFPYQTFRMSRNHKSIKQVWDEWKHGGPNTPSVEYIERKFGTAWRVGDGDRRYFNRRRALIQELEAYVRNGVNEEPAVKDAQTVMDRKNWTLARLQDEIRMFRKHATADARHQNFFEMHLRQQQ